MKLKFIENICRQVVALVLLTGICLLYCKGVIPVYLSVLFLMSGTLVRLAFRTFTFVLKTILVLIVMVMASKTNHARLKYLFQQALMMVTAYASQVKVKRAVPVYKTAIYMSKYA